MSSGLPLSSTNNSLHIFVCCPVNSGELSHPLRGFLHPVLANTDGQLAPQNSVSRVASLPASRSFPSKEGLQSVRVSFQTLVLWQGKVSPCKPEGGTPPTRLFLGKPLGLGGGEGRQCGAGDGGGQGGWGSGSGENIFSPANYFP